MLDFRKVALVGGAPVEGARYGGGFGALRLSTSGFTDLNRHKMVLPIGISPRKRGSVPRSTLTGSRLRAPIPQILAVVRYLCCRSQLRGFAACIPGTVRSFGQKHAQVGIGFAPVLRRTHGRV